MSPTTGWVRRHRGAALVTLVVLATLVVLSILGVGAAVRDGDLDPDNPEAAGAQAVARVLADHGVRVSVVRRAADLDRTTLDRDTTVLVTSTGNLGRSTARRLEAHTVTAGAVVLAAPGPTVLRALRLPVALDDTAGAAHVESRCDDPLLDGLTVDAGPTTGYRARAGANVVTCFRGPGARPVSLVARVDRASVPTYAVGSTDLFTNEHVDRADNAAVALRLLGQHSRLVWYVPAPGDVAPGDAGSLRGQLPGGLVPASWLLGATVLATMLWRGRRLGPLVVEPLPVVVRAVESTQGRGRLYRRVRDRAHAAAILRDATRRRLTSRLRLPATTDHRHLVSAVAGTTGRDPDQLHDLLLTRPVPDDAALTRLADDLSALEEEVHHP